MRPCFLAIVFSFEITIHILYLFSFTGLLLLLADIYQPLTYLARKWAHHLLYVGWILFLIFHLSVNFGVFVFVFCSGGDQSSRKEDILNNTSVTIRHRLHGANRDLLCLGAALTLDNRVTRSECWKASPVSTATAALCTTLTLTGPLPVLFCQHSDPNMPAPCI